MPWTSRRLVSSNRSTLASTKARTRPTDGCRRSNRWPVAVRSRIASDGLARCVERPARPGLEPSAGSPPSSTPAMSYLVLARNRAESRVYSKADTPPDILIPQAAWRPSRSRCTGPTDDRTRQQLYPNRLNELTADIPFVAHFPCVPCAPCPTRTTWAGGREGSEQGGPRANWVLHKRRPWTTQTGATSHRISPSVASSACAGPRSHHIRQAHASGPGPRPPQPVAATQGPRQVRAAIPSTPSPSRHADRSLATRRAPAPSSEGRRRSGHDRHGIVAAGPALRFRRTNSGLSRSADIATRLGWEPQHSPRGRGVHNPGSGHLPDPQCLPHAGQELLAVATRSAERLVRAKHNGHGHA